MANNSISPNKYPVVLKIRSNKFGNKESVKLARISSQFRHYPKVDGNQLPGLTAVEVFILDWKLSQDSKTYKQRYINL